ncbi:GAF domain-containing sensor histidine kinase [Pedococcus sp. KACC 23699]|uniref:Sensor-like histidine kinase SenX3 n=1 Tax=Pedococcus sp. KACC 23699 TaxID=3149228 RepID=A0AAU7JXA6_9MICO
MSSGQDLARREAIEDYEVVGRPAEPDLQRLVELAAAVCDVPTAVINIIDDRQQHQIAAIGLSASVCSREDSMCARVLHDPQLVAVPDASLDERFAQNPFVTGLIANIRFYASSPLITPAGVPIGTLCVFDDVPRRLSAAAGRALGVLAEQVVDVLELRRLSRELARSNEQLTQFAGQVSHDLRNPLAALTGFLELAADSPELADAPDAAELLARAESSAARMTAMIGDLLDFARIGGGGRQGMVDLQGEADAVLEDLSAQIAGAAADVQVMGLPKVAGDATLLRALLQNLVANAVKFSAAVVGGGTPVVRVGAEHITGGWRVTVDDNGPGVPKEDRDRVFELLARGDDKQDVEGLGIGLSTCRRIVQSHGGRIGIADSELGGASVWVSFPDGLHR